MNNNMGKEIPDKTITNNTDKMKMLTHTQKLKDRDMC
jgi:hypothetical protein